MTTHPMESNATVVIPAYNSAGFLPECLDSVLSQSLPPFEVILVDDGSTDGTPEIGRRYQDKSGGKIQYVRKANGGVASARNEGLRRARGKYIAFLDSDDIWFPHWLAKTVDFMERHPEAGLVFTDMEQYDGGRLIHASFLKTRKCYPALMSRPEAVPDVFCLILKECFILHSGALLRTESLRKIGFFDETLDLGEDMDGFLRLALRYPVACLPEVLLKRQFHSSNLSRHRLRPLLGMLDVVQKMRREHPDAFARCRKDLASSLADMHYEAGYFLQEERRYAEARRHFLASLGQRLSPKVAYALAGAFLKPFLKKRPIPTAP